MTTDKRSCPGQPDQCRSTTPSGKGHPPCYGTGCWWSTAGLASPRRLRGRAAHVREPHPCMTRWGRARHRGALPWPTTGLLSGVTSALGLHRRSSPPAAMSVQGGPDPLQICFHIDGRPHRQPPPRLQEADEGGSCRPACPTPVQPGRRPHRLFDAPAQDPGAGVKKVFIRSHPLRLYAHRASSCRAGEVSCLRPARGPEHRERRTDHMGSPISRSMRSSRAERRLNQKYGKEQYLVPHHVLTWAVPDDAVRLAE